MAILVCSVKQEQSDRK